MKKGSKQSKEARQKMREAKIGTKASDETRAKMAASRAGKKDTEETKQKKRAAGLGRTHSATSRAKIGAATRARVVTDETRHKVSMAAKSKVRSPETRNKISAALLGKPKSEAQKAAHSAIMRGRKLAPAHIAKAVTGKGRVYWSKEVLEDYLSNFFIAVVKFPADWLRVNPNKLNIQCICTTHDHVFTATKRWLVNDMQDGCPICYPGNNMTFKDKIERKKARIAKAISGLQPMFNERQSDDA